MHIKKLIALFVVIACLTSIASAATAAPAKAPTVAQLHNRIASLKVRLAEAENAAWREGVLIDALREDGDYFRARNADLVHRLAEACAQYPTADGCPPNNG